MLKFKTTIYIVLISVFVSLSYKCKAQERIINDNEQISESKIYTSAQVSPEFTGGMSGFADYVSNNYKIPTNFSGSGTIYLSFIVERDGSLTGIKIIGDLGYGTGLEAVRIMKISPKWKPGIQNGKPVRVSYNLPIKLTSK